MRHLLLCALSLMMVCGNGQAVHLPPAFDYQRAVGGSRLQSDAFVFISNPAFLINLARVSAGVFANRHFMLASLQTAGISIAVPVKANHIGFHIAHTGDEASYQTRATFSVAKKLGKLGAAGVDFNYHLLGVKEYGTAGAVGFTVGGLLHLSQNVQAAVSIGNLNRSRFNAVMPERLAARAELVVGCDVSENIYLSAALTKIETVPSVVSAAFQYKPASRLHCRLGFGTGPDAFFIGCGYGLGAVRIEVFSALHPLLGLSPGLQVVLVSKNRE